MNCGFSMTKLVQAPVPPIVLLYISQKEYFAGYQMYSTS